MSTVANLAMIAGAATAIGICIGQFYYLLHYLDKMEQRINQRFDRLEKRFDDLILKLERKHVI